ncbi:DUF3108 domain-containing protein [Portibacter lacus]|uniref:DUF3108 domain-containing protein n=1 Tax=Portibacter lacus TaxID=1099794 RepID=A0AA37WEZ8_9BACT|nr:DUF3108 domain-containing protein [Portibacter lacus]GLR18313.1 hypothetical protein GCM10007940_29290 [Portibacter lacus]
MNKLLLSALLLFAMNMVYGQSACSKYYPFTQGTVSEITSYDKKGKVAAVIEYTVKASTDKKATIINRMVDSKGELITESEFDIICTGDGVEIDIKSMANPQLLTQYKDMETTISGSDVVLPNNMKKGDELPDAEMFISVNMGGINMNIDVMMLDRKVVGKESVTTPAGTFDCIVIEYQSKIKMGLEKKGSAKQWIAEGVGMVKQEDYNKKGKVTSSSMLTAFKK